MPSAGRSDHAVVFYQGSELAGVVGEHLIDAIRNGGAAVVVATGDHRLWLDGWLAEAGVDLAAARRQGSYVVLDAADAMKRFMIGGRPDPAAFWQVFSPALRQAAGSRSPVRVFGEMVSLLWEAGLVNAAIEVEALWNELAAHCSFSLLCAYPAASVTGAEHTDALAQVCSAHSAVAGLELDPDQAPFR